MVFLYFFVNSWTQREKGVVWNLQARLQRRESFLRMAVLPPRPPYCFGRVTVFQFTMCILFLTSVVPQIKFYWVLSRSLWTFLGRRMNCMTWLVTLLRQVLVRVTLPAMLRNLFFILQVWYAYYQEEIGS